MLSVDEALANILAAASPLSTSTVPLADSWGRVLAEDVLSGRLIPAVANSRMDGYAVRSADLTGASLERAVTLAVTQTVYAGQAPLRPLGPGEAARVMTGAPIPDGADQVVPQEQAIAVGETVRVRAAPWPCEFVRSAGDDARPGEIALRRGVRLGPSEIAMLAALGKTHVLVGRRPRVAILSTGDELCAIDEEPGGRVVDSNAWGLAVRVAEAGGEPVKLGTAPDDPVAVERLIEAAETCDIVLSSAGVSAGERDFVRQALASQGVTLQFWQVAMRPGRPIAFGLKDRRLYFALPGNPTSNAVSFELFVRPALLALQSATEVARPRVRVTLELPLRKPAGLAAFVAARVGLEGPRLVAHPRPREGAGFLRAMIGANALLTLPAGVERLEMGAEVEAILLF